MSESPRSAQTGSPRIPVGIHGLDDVLDGGLLRGGLYLLLGASGTGKTTAANQICFSRSRAGGVAVYATVLVESHAQMLTHLQGSRFFDPSQVAHTVHYVSLFDELTTGGLDGALGLLRRLVRERSATLLIVDGAGLFGDFASSPLEFRRFAAELHTQVSALGCTTVLLADEDDSRVLLMRPQVDGPIELEDLGVQMRDLRLLRVIKLRDAEHDTTLREYTISSRGVEVSGGFASAESVLTGIARGAAPSAGDAATVGEGGR